MGHDRENRQHEIPSPWDSDDNAIESLAATETGRGLCRDDRSDRAATRTAAV